MHIAINFSNVNVNYNYDSSNRESTSDGYRVIVPVDDIIMEDLERIVTHRNDNTFERPPSIEHEYRIIIKNFASTRNFGEVMKNGNYVFKVDVGEYERVMNLIHRHNVIQAMEGNVGAERDERRWDEKDVNNLLGIELG